MLDRQSPGGRGKAEEHITSRPPAAGSPRKTVALIASGIAMALTLAIFDGLGVSFGVGLLPALLRGMLIVLIGGAIGPRTQLGAHCRARNGARHPQAQRKESGR